MTNLEIAERLTIAETTVKRHLDNIYGKPGVSPRTAAATAAVRSGLISSLLTATRIPIDDEHFVRGA